jgi:hypothetical protein
MYDNYLSDEPAANLLERRWFAAGRAAAELQIECDALTHVLEQAQDAWRTARARLSQLAALRDALGEELVAGDERDLRYAPASARRSAAARWRW